MKTDDNFSYKQGGRRLLAKIIASHYSANKQAGMFSTPGVNYLPSLKMYKLQTDSVCEKYQISEEEFLLIELAVLAAVDALDEQSSAA